MSRVPPFNDEDTFDGGLVAKESAGDNAAALSVSEISAQLKRTVEDRFAYVRVRGELSGVKRAASGHVYLALKDENARLDGVMWRGTVGRLNFQPEDGLEVIATGKLTTYPGRSNYQIVIERMEIAGEGALLALLARNKARFEAEGLFAPERKRRLPFLPRVIGVVTSPTGAVIRDILHRLADRFPTHVVVWPVLVQGQGAAEQVAAAVRGFSALAPGGPAPRPDLVIVARGGGSIEDLWAFNEEVVVRAIAGSTIPVISAVGHETDTTLADFAADLRAPTPTAAAEIAVPVREELLAQLGELALRQRRAVARPVQLGRERLAVRAERLPAPQALLSPHAQRLDELSERLRRGLGERTHIARADLQRIAGRHSLPLLSARLDRARDRLDALARLAQSLDPDRVLQRGYVRVTGADGRTLVSREAAAQEAALTLHFRDGELAVAPGDSAPSRAQPKPKAPPRPAPPEQGKLL
ncbi:exodeoxyribonuclease VII large subunit [Novosphingobium sp.]|uniref:exodeoxyribonuclease VII large subunit n=1 Tax=Novosphingobium sp. TaxID=1874826 RepID=UPI0035B0D3D2